MFKLPLRVEPSSDAHADPSCLHTLRCAVQKLKAQFPVFLSDFPIEVRQYPKGAEMPWHLDEQMYASPQWELIYTLDNSSDSRCGQWLGGRRGG